MKGECAMSLVLEFVSCVIKNLVAIPEDIMDGWVQNPKALQKALTDALCPPVQEPTRRWREQNGVIYFSVTSNGMTGPQWIEYFKKKGISLTKWAKDVLLSSDFKPTNGVTIEVAVLKGILFTDKNRVTSKIRADADKRKLVKPNAELGCLIRDMFIDAEIEDMGLIWIVAFHEPIKDSDGYPRLLGVSRDDGGYCLDAYFGEPDDVWDCGSGFAFAVSQVSS